MIVLFPFQYCMTLLLWCRSLQDFLSNVCRQASRLNVVMQKSTDLTRSFFISQKIIGDSIYEWKLLVTARKVLCYRWLEWVGKKCKSDEENDAFQNWNKTGPDRYIIAHCVPRRHTRMLWLECQKLDGKHTKRSVQRNSHLFWGATKCTCPVLNAPRADTPFCLEYPPEGFSQRADMQDKNGVFIPRAFKQGWCTCNFMKSGLSG
jgi:hypothetical protein